MIWDVVVIGGGVAGLVNAFLLSTAGLRVVLVESKSYPFHRVCGEYISNEVRTFLELNGLFPTDLQPSQISKFILSSTKGHVATMPLDLGGFGISRYAFDHFLYQKASTAGATFLLGRKALGIHFEENQFRVDLNDGQQLRSTLVVGAFGKRSKIDQQMGRQFLQKNSDYLGVKYHVKTDFPTDTIALHNFEGGYCGISSVENNRYNLCYLSTRSQLKKYGDIKTLESAVLMKNPLLKQIFEQAEFVFKKPLVINEFSFEAKSPVENHVLMSGDAAGLITPLCGNGMAMAIHSAKILSTLTIKFFNGSLNRVHLENDYRQLWLRQFNSRLWVGRNTQKMFGNPWVSNLSTGLVRTVRPLAKLIMRNTHGKPIV